MPKGYPKSGVNKGWFRKGKNASASTQFKKGITPWVKGKTKKDYPQISGGGVSKGNIPWNKGKEGVQTAWNKGLKGYRAGEKNNKWKGGITLLTAQIRQSFEYRQWRSDVFTRDKFYCQICNQWGRHLEAHHIKPFYKIIEENNIKILEEALICEELWNINNGKTLCKKCHDKIRHSLKKS